MINKEKLGLYTRLHPSIKKYIERQDRYLNSLAFFGEAITVDSTDDEIKSICEKN